MNSKYELPVNSIVKGWSFMKVRCKDLLELPSFQHIRLVGGKNGLHRIVRCPYVTLTNTIDQWVHGGEFMFVSGIGYGSDEENLLKLLAESNEKNLSGIVILVGPDYIKTIPPDVIALADRFGLPLFEMPFRIPLVEPTEEISSFIVKNRLEDQFLSEILTDIFSGRCDSEESVISKAAFYHCDLSGPHKVAVLSLSGSGQRPGETVPQTGEISIEWMLGCQRNADDTFKRHGYNVLSMIDCRSILFLLPDKSHQDNREMEQVLLEIRRIVLRKDAVAQAAVGMGRTCENLHGVAKSRKEAEWALKAGRLSGGDEVCRFEDLGVFKVLFQIDDFSEMERYCNEVFDRLEQIDAKDNMHLLETLEIYLEEDCNTIRTAQRLYLHRNSLNYRIKKIEKIMDCDFTAYESRLRFRNAFLIKNFLRIAK